MSEPKETDNTEVQLRKYCTEAKMDERSGMSKIKVRKTAAAAAAKVETPPPDPNAEKRKWPALCDANPFIVDLLKNLFQKEEPPPPPPPPPPPAKK